MRAYETVFILSPVLTDSQVKECVARYMKLFSDSQAEIIYEEDMGLKPLSYTIKGKQSGYYHLVEFRAEATLIESLETAYKRDDSMLRYLIVKQDKYSLAYNEDRRRKQREEKERNAAEEKRKAAEAEAQEKAEATLAEERAEEKAEERAEEKQGGVEPKETEQGA